MEDNLQNSSGARSASEALSKMKENRQRQASTSQSSQTIKPRITQNSAPCNNSNSSNGDGIGCGGIIMFAVFFMIGFAICSML